MYKYTLPLPVQFEINKKFNFESDWINISGNKITIPKNYSWDGCTPSWRFLGKWWGTPDSKETFYGSLLHDAIYQYKDKMVLSRKDADELFKQVLVNQKFKFASVYYTAVRLVGRIKGKWKTRTNHKLILRKISVL